MQSSDRILASYRASRDNSISSDGVMDGTASWRMISRVQATSRACAIHMCPIRRRPTRASRSDGSARSYAHFRKSVTSRAVTSSSVTGSSTLLRASFMPDENMVANFSLEAVKNSLCARNSHQKACGSAAAASMLARGALLGARCGAAAGRRLMEAGAGDHRASIKLGSSARRHGEPPILRPLPLPFRAGRGPPPHRPVRGGAERGRTALRRTGPFRQPLHQTRREIDRNLRSESPVIRVPGLLSRPRPGRQSNPEGAARLHHRRHPRPCMGRSQVRRLHRLLPPHVLGPVPRAVQGAGLQLRLRQQARVEGCLAAREDDRAGGVGVGVLQGGDGGGAGGSEAAGRGVCAGAGEEGVLVRAL